MKSLLGILAIAAALQTPCLAQLIRITHVSRDGTLAWTNPLCTTTPVYQILQANSVTGPWAHLAYITNQNTYRLASPVPNGSSAFYRIVWTDDVPVVLSYIYYEDDFPAIIGELTLDFASLSASWHFEDTGLSSGVHPEGSGIGPLGFTSDLLTWAIVVRPGLDDTVFLAGALESSSTGSGCEYDGYVGLVYYTSFAGTEPIGDFVAFKP